MSCDLWIRSKSAVQVRILSKHMRFPANCPLQQIWEILEHIQEAHIQVDSEVSSTQIPAWQRPARLRSRTDVGRMYRAPV